MNGIRYQHDFMRIDECQRKPCMLEQDLVQPEEMAAVLSS